MNKKLKKILNLFLKLFLFSFLTITTQIGGIAYLISRMISLRIESKSKAKSVLVFIAIYGMMTFLIIPFVAPVFGREKVRHSEKIKPANYLTVILNRNYVRPALNELLRHVENNLKGTAISINYLDANFPFINEFPLLPHLSHHDGKKIDLSLIYETLSGEITDLQKSNSGYGVFEEPKKNESNQIRKCLDNGFFQYDYPKYLTLGTKNKTLRFSETGTKKLIVAILKEKELGKIFIEPHLKERLNLVNNKVRYHGCRAVRHDDHIHIQLK